MRWASCCSKELCTVRGVVSHPRMEIKMDKEHLKGAADKVKGAVEDAAGKATGDKKLQAEGKFDKAKGSVHTALGNAKDAVKDAVKDRRDM
jgi:uncharacterized protein YjbJ (UPF0337 family)